MTNNGNFVTFKKVYDRNIVNKYRLYSLHDVTFNQIDYISIFTDAELIHFVELYIYIYNSCIKKEEIISVGEVVSC